MAIITFMMLFQVSCSKPHFYMGYDGSNDFDTSPTEEGIYLGVIGFNQELKTKAIELLDESNIKEFSTFIDGLQMEKGTGLYYADYVAIDRLKSYEEPPKLTEIALVTFTDGLDNVSLVDEKTNPENFSSKTAYAEALNNKIKTETIHGKKISAYTIGIKGNDVTNETEFYNNLNMLSSSSDNVYEATDMNEALEQFQQIAESLYSSTTISTLKIEIPGGYDDNTKIRFTFDNVSSAEESDMYVEAKYIRTSDGRSLVNISYHGLKGTETSLSSISKNGAYYVFEFTNLTDAEGNVILQNDIKNLRLWTQISSGLWQPDVEFTPDTSSEVTEEKSSALIMLVLDCTTSLGDQFSNMKYAAQSFVETLLNTSSSSGGEGNGYHDGNEYVDLGLPSRLKWATCNVGASSPEEYGNYYALDRNRMEFLNTENGYSYRIPSKKDFKELINKCTWQWENKNGVDGYKVIGPNGNSIFLPAAGRYDWNSIVFQGTYGYYYTSTYSGDDAYFLYFKSYKYDLDNYGFYDCMSIRLVEYE